MKKNLAILAVLLLTLGLFAVACGEDKTDEPTDTTKAAGTEGGECRIPTDTVEACDAGLVCDTFIPDDAEGETLEGSKCIVPVDGDEETVDGDEETVDGDEETVDGDEDGDQEQPGTFCTACITGEGTLVNGDGAALTPEAIDKDGAAGDGTWRTGGIMDNATALNWGYNEGKLVLGFGKLSKLVKFVAKDEWVDPSSVDDLDWTGPVDIQTSYDLDGAKTYIFVLKDETSTNTYSFAFQLTTNPGADVDLGVEYVFNPTANDMTLLAPAAE